MIDKRKQPISVYLLSKQVRTLIEEGRRIDGRGLDEFRSLKIETGVIENADGSAYVELGKTIVVAGIKFEPGTPFPDTPNEGILIVEGEVLPLASLSAEPGPPTEDEIELSRVVDRGIRESGMIDLKDLVIKPGEKVLKTFIDFNVINDSGNIIDASFIAAVSALITSKHPNVEELREMEEPDISKVSKIPLKIHDIPTSITFANLFGKLVVDPLTEEEAVMDARLTITLTREGLVCAVQKGGGGSFSFEQISEALNIAKRVSNIIRKKISSSTGVGLAG